MKKIYCIAALFLCVYSAYSQRGFARSFSHNDQNGSSSLKTNFPGTSFYEDSSLCKVYTISGKGLNTSKAEYSPVYYKGELVYVQEKSKPLFAPWKGKFFALYSAERADTVSFEKSFSFNKHMQNKYYNGPICLTPDDSTLYFTRAASPKLTRKAGRKKPLKQQIFYTEINEFGLAHTEVHPFIYNSFDYDCMHPAIDKSGKKIYFASDMPGTLGGKDIFVSEWKDNMWGQPKNLGPSINSAGDEEYPFISDDGVLYFASNSRPGLGGWDIFYADPTREGGFRDAENVGSTINSQYDDFGIFVLRGGARGYFSSNRKSGNDDNDIYYFINNKPKSFPVQIRFVDSVYSGSMPVSFTVTSALGTETQSLDSGKVYDTRLKNGREVSIVASSPKHRSKLFIKKLNLDDTLITVALRPRSQKCISGVIIDKDSKKPISGVKVAIYDEDGNKYLDILTDSSGIYRVCELPLTKDLYIGSQKKPQYFTNTERFKILPDSDLLKDIYAQEIVIGKAIKVENIYFDQGKFDVRADAKPELDKLVQLMKDNPEVIIELSSHTDCVGPASSNMLLSDKRAKSSAAYIISKGISKNRIKGKGYGETKLLNDCKCEGKKPSPCSEEQHAVNRRTEFKVTGFISSKPEKATANQSKGSKGK
jgi:outer membrane protein OmpA-like peptidoglycan-associated protein